MKSETFNCAVCGSSFKSIGPLHTHIRRDHSLSQEDYYLQFYPRHDLFNGSLIPYKNYRDYFSRRFVDKKSEFAFLRRGGFDGVIKDILSEQLKECAEKAGGRFPMYCEWRSSKNIRYDWLDNDFSVLPSLIELSDSLYSRRLKYDKPERINGVNEGAALMIDTREQKPLFGGERKTINVGDYCFAGEHYNNIHIDRKSEADFIGTFTSGLERFKKECEKAKTLGVDLVVLVEAPFIECFRYRPLKFTKQIVGGENAFHGARQISRQYNIQFVFCDSRESSKHYVKFLLSNPELVRGYDLQFLLEKKYI